MSLPQVHIRYNSDLQKKSLTEFFSVPLQNVMLQNKQINKGWQLVAHRKTEGCSNGFFKTRFTIIKFLGYWAVEE
jgi:hypothetical protein